MILKFALRRFPVSNYKVGNNADSIFGIPNEPPVQFDPYNATYKLGAFVFLLRECGMRGRASDSKHFSAQVAHFLCVVEKRTQRII